MKSGAILVLLAALSSSSAFARPHLQTKLPSEVKSIRVQTKKQQAKANTKAPAKKAAVAKKAAPVVSKKPILEETLDPSTSKYRTRTVFFWKSRSPLPKSYRCDDDIESKKKFEAEQQALGKCEANGAEECSLKEVRIVKNGKLTCADIPGNGCERGYHYAGCVAEAVVLGEKIGDQWASASSEEETL